MTFSFGVLISKIQFDQAKKRISFLIFKTVLLKFIKSNKIEEPGYFKLLSGKPDKQIKDFSKTKLVDACHSLLLFLTFASLTLLGLVCILSLLKLLHHSFRDSLRDFYVEHVRRHSHYLTNSLDAVIANKVIPEVVSSQTLILLHAKLYGVQHLILLRELVVLN